MMPRPHGNTQTIQQRSEIEMMDISYQKGDDCSPFGCFTEYTHPGNLFQPLQSVSCQFMLMGCYLLKSIPTSET